MRGSEKGNAERPSSILIVTQIAISLALVLGAGLLLRTFESLRPSILGSTAQACSECFFTDSPPVSMPLTSLLTARNWRTNSARFPA